MLSIKKILDFYIKNNDEEYFYENINAKYKNNTYVFNIENDKYEIKVDNKIILKKENNESLLEFIFDENKETNATYYIKELDFYMDAKINTIYTKKEVDIVVEYKLTLQDEEIGNFIFKLKDKE